MDTEKTGYDIIGEEVRKYWEVYGIPCEVICYFKQKYSYENENEWEQERVYADSTSSHIDDTDVVFEYDFWEGQTDYKDIKIYNLDSILDVFDLHKDEYYNDNEEDK